MKATKEQIDRSLKKLAKQMAVVNKPNLDGSHDDHYHLWQVFMIAFRLLRKTGADKYYHEEMRRLNKPQQGRGG